MYYILRNLFYLKLILQNKDMTILFITLPLGVSESQSFFVIDSPIVGTSTSVAGFETSMFSKTCLVFGRPFF